MDLCQKKQSHLQASDPPDVGDTWIWKAIALPSHLRVVSHISHERSELEATTFLALFKGRTDHRPPLFTSDKLAAYLAALIANYSISRPARERRSGRPQRDPGRILDEELLYAQIDKQREDGRIIEVRRRVLIGAQGNVVKILGNKQINTSYVERDNLTSRQSNGRLVRKTLSHSKKVYYLQRHIALEDAVFNFVRPHQSLRLRLPKSIEGRKWHQRTPAMAAGLTDHVWSLEELLSYRLPRPQSQLSLPRVRGSAPSYLTAAVLPA